MAKDTDRQADGRRAPFWRQLAGVLAGEWWRDPGPIAQQARPSGPGSDATPRAQADPRAVGHGVAVGDRSMDYSSYLPMPRLLDGVANLWIDDLSELPVTTYPLLEPRVPRSSLQTLGAIRTNYAIDTEPVTGPIGPATGRAYPRAFDANTRVDMRWRAGGPGFQGGVEGRTPNNAQQPGYPFQRTARRIPRYSTLPAVSDVIYGPLTQPAQ